MTQSYRADCRAIARLRQARLRLGCLRAGFALWRKLPAPDRMRDLLDFAFLAGFRAFAGAFAAERTVSEALRLLLPVFAALLFVEAPLFAGVLGTVFDFRALVPPELVPLLPVPADLVAAPLPRLIPGLAARLVAAGFRFLGPFVSP